MVDIIRIYGIPPEDLHTETTEQDNSTFVRFSVVNFTEHCIKECMRQSSSIIIKYFDSLLFKDKHSDL